MDELQDNAVLMLHDRIDKVVVWLHQNLRYRNINTEQIVHIVLVYPYKSVINEQNWVLLDIR